MTDIFSLFFICWMFASLLFMIHGRVILFPASIESRQRRDSGVNIGQLRAKDVQSDKLFAGSIQAFKVTSGHIKANEIIADFITVVKSGLVQSSESGPSKETKVENPQESNKESSSKNKQTPDRVSSAKTEQSLKMKPLNEGGNPEIHLSKSKHENSSGTKTSNRPKHPSLNAKQPPKNGGSSDQICQTKHGHSSNETPSSKTEHSSQTKSITKNCSSVEIQLPQPTPTLPPGIDKEFENAILRAKVIKSENIDATSLKARKIRAKGVKTHSLITKNVDLTKKSFIFGKTE